MLSDPSTMLLTALSLSLCASCDAKSDFVLTSPQERQVFQRDEHGNGKVLVAGRCADGYKPSDFEITIDLASRAKLDVRTLAFTDVDGPLQQFRGEIEVPQGGWHSLEVRAHSADTSFPLAHVERFGVGEVFVIAGQSNSANFGEVRFGSLDDRVSSFDGKTWNLARDPMPGVQDGSRDGSPWPYFGKLLRESIGVPIGIASVGFGGTSIGEWQPGGGREIQGRTLELYAGLRDRVRALGKVRAVLWHQGESDAEHGTPRALYESRFEKLAKQLDADTGAKQTWVTARATYQPQTPKAACDAIRTAQESLWTRGLSLQGPDTDDMLDGLRHSGDHVHFNRAGLEEHARRWHALVLKHFFPDAKPSSPVSTDK